MNAARIRLAVFCCLSLVPLVVAESASAGNWPKWRGPQGTGVSNEKDLPIAWSANTAIAWQTKLPGWGASTPAIWNGAVFVTSMKDDDLLLTRVDKATGAIVWTKKVGSGKTTRKDQIKGRGAQKFHNWHNLASPSPETDGKYVVVHFGNGDLAVYDFSGKQLWHRNLQKDHGKYTIWWGHSNTSVLYRDLVISACMQDSLVDLGKPAASSYLVAHDVETGKVRWHTPRKTRADAEQCDSYTTPLLARNGERVDLIVMGGNQLDAYDPASGKQRWYLPDLIGGRTVTGPTVAHGLVYVTRGMRGPLLAVRPKGKGKLTRRAITWKYRAGTPDACSPVVWKDLLFTITDDGIARCFDARRGPLKWKHRLPGQYKASPIAADGRIYFLNTDGVCSVVSTVARFDRLTENSLGEKMLASPAISDGRLFFRGRESLFCIQR